MLVLYYYMFVKKDRSIKKVVKNRKCNWQSLKKSRGKPFKFNNSSKERQLSINTTSKLNVPLLPKGKGDNLSLELINIYYHILH